MTTEYPALELARRPVETVQWAPFPHHHYRGWRLTIKRAFDVALAAGLLVATFPLLLATAFVVRVSSRGPVIFRQRRVGQHGELFTVYKFRTMHPDADLRLLEEPALYSQYRDGGFKIAIDEDPRVTPIGRFLRKSSIDELPQLINVLRGSMSMIGPRPVVPDELAEYGEFVDAYLMALPGLTGAWQVAGRDNIRFPERAELDANYIDTWSLLQDVRIALMTIPATIAARGVE